MYLYKSLEKKWRTVVSSKLNVENCVLKVLDRQNLNIKTLHGWFFTASSKVFTLTAHNWQKRVFLTCTCYEIYRDEAVGLQSCKYT